MDSIPLECGWEKLDQYLAEAWKATRTDMLTGFCMSGEICFLSFRANNMLVQGLNCGTNFHCRWLDKLGQAAQLKIGVVMHSTFLDGDRCFVQKTGGYRPLPVSGV